MTWDRISSELGLAQTREADIHPHDPRERAELFHVRDNSGCTEFEFLNLLHALVLATKPSFIVETGTFTGMGTLAIASAMGWNGGGKLVTVDLEPCDEAKAHVARFGFGHLVEFRQEDAVQFCERYDGPTLDMAFIDSGSSRSKEALSLRSKMKAGGIIALHDSSHLRLDQPVSWGAIFDRDVPIQSFSIPLSRGLRLMFT